jgi:hypothetical protein
MKSFIHNQSGIAINSYYFKLEDWIALHPEYKLPEGVVFQTYTSEYRVGLKKDGQEVNLPFPWPEGDVYIQQSRDDFFKINQISNWKRWAKQLMSDIDMDAFLFQCPHHRVSFLIALIIQEQPIPELILSCWGNLSQQVNFSAKTIERWNGISKDNNIPISFS